LKKELGTPSMMRRWLRSSRLAWMMESLLTGRGLTYIGCQPLAERSHGLPLSTSLHYIQSDEELARALNGNNDDKGPDGWSSDEEPSKKKSKKCSQPKEHQGRNWRQQAAHLKERNGYQDRYNRTHNPRPPSERFHAHKPNYAKREDFKQAVKVAAAQMAAQAILQPQVQPTGRHEQ
jgi:hypothetical protein